MTYQGILKELAVFASEHGKEIDAFYLHKEECYGRELVDSMQWQFLYGTGKPISEFSSDLELIESGLHLAGVPIKVCE